MLIWLRSNIYGEYTFIMHGEKGHKFSVFPEKCLFNNIVLRLINNSASHLISGGKVR